MKKNTNNKIMKKTRKNHGFSWPFLPVKLLRKTRRNIAEMADLVRAHELGSNFTQTASMGAALSERHGRFRGDFLGGEIPMKIGKIPWTSGKSLGTSPWIWHEQRHFKLVFIHGLNHRLRWFFGENRGQNRRLGDLKMPGNMENMASNWMFTSNYVKTCQNLVFVGGFFWCYFCMFKTFPRLVQSSRFVGDQVTLVPWSKVHASH